MLINFFMELKKARIPVSITELLQLIEVLKARLVYADIDEFYYLSRMTMVKDERHYDKFDRAFSAYFKGLEDLASLLSSLIPDEYLRREFEKSLTKEELEKIKSLGGLEKLIEAFKEEVSKILYAITFLYNLKDESLNKGKIKSYILKFYQSGIICFYTAFYR